MVPQGGFGRLFPMQGCTRLAVKLDFITGALYKALQCTGSLEFRGVQAQVGEVVAWRNLFWSLTDAMYGNASEWHSGAFLPSAEALRRPIACWRRRPTRRSRRPSSRWSPAA